MVVGRFGQRKAFDGLPMAKLLPQILAATSITYIITSGNQATTHCSGNGLGWPASTT